jgi:hypothetical protein
MEDADAILVLGLRDVLGADLPASVTASRDFDCDVFVKCVGRCLRAIAPDDAASVADRLPADMSGRFRVGTDLAGRVQRLGYRGDVGFHQLLYPNEADVRRMLTFLLDKVPKATTSGGAQVEGAAASAAARVHSALRAWVAKPPRGGDAAAAPATPPAAGAGGRPFWTCALAADDASTLLTSQAAPTARLAPSLLELAAASALQAASGAESELARLASSAAPLASSGAHAAAVRAAVAASLSQKPRARVAAGNEGAAAQRAAAGSEAAASVPRAVTDTDGSGAAVADAALTAEARLARSEAELAALQAQLRGAVDSVAAAEARAAAAEEAEAEAQREAAAAAAATPRLEQEYLLRKQTAALLVVRVSSCMHNGMLRCRSGVSLTSAGPDCLLLAPSPAPPPPHPPHPHLRCRRRAAARWRTVSRS